MTIPNTVHYFTEDHAEELAAMVLAKAPSAPVAIWDPRGDAAWCLDSIRLIALSGTSASTLLRAAALVAERYEGKDNS